MSAKNILFVLLLMSGGLIAQEDSAACPCCTAEHHSFDCWIGEWQVFRPDGQFAGTNRITRQQDSCLLREDWTSANGNYTGTSYNYFDRKDSHWHQLWIDNQGEILRLSGRRTGNQMILSSSGMQDSTGKMIVHRITWTANPDGTVRQHWESMQEGGEWTTLFDGLYKQVN